MICFRKSPAHTTHKNTQSHTQLKPYIINAEPYMTHIMNAEPYMTHIMNAEPYTTHIMNT